MGSIFVMGNPKDAKFPASKIAKDLGLDYPDVGSDDDDDS